MRSSALLVLVLAVLISTPAMAQIGGFGYQAESSVDDERYELQTGGPQTLLLVDGDGDERIDPGEPVFLSASTSQVTVGAVRMAYPGTSELGTQVEAGDPHQGNSAVALSGQFTYLDVDGDSIFSRDEPIFFEDSNLDSSEVDRGELVVHGKGAGTGVESGDWRLSQATSSLSTNLGYVDTDNNGAFGLGDRAYLNLYGDGWASIPDVRLTPISPYAFGSLLQPGQEKVTHRFASGNSPGEVIYVDGNSDGRLDGEEPVFLSKSTDEVRGDSIRLAHAANDKLGSSVGADSQGELGDPANQVDGEFAFDDQDSDGGLDPGETLYYDRNEGNSGEADGNDVILSGGDAGLFVRETSRHVGTDLTSAPGSLEYLDRDANNKFSFRDPVFLDGDSDGFVSAGDVQLTNHTTPEPPDTDGDGIDDSEDNCPDTSNADQTDTDDDGTGDACDADRDGDGVDDGQDNCPDTQNANQTDSDGDGTGDACDEAGGDDTQPDHDADGVPDSEDNCPGTSNADQTDTDADGEGDACDQTPEGAPDTDGDGVDDGEDNCINTENPDQTNTDGDGAGDACDGDIDGDGLTNARERGLGTDPAKVDTDGDGVRDDQDNCPTTANADQADENDDGTGDACADAGPSGTPGVPALGVIAVLVVTVLATRRRA